MSDPYLGFVGFYDLWSAPMTEDVDFYVRQSTAVPGPVVELGVGTGRVAIPVARAGQRVIGVDASPSMLAEGRRRAEAAGVAGRITFVEGDMRSFVADPPVSLVTIPFRSFLHLLTADDQLGALASIRDSLAPGGRLVMNVFLPDPVFMAQQDGRREFRGEFTDERGRRCELWSVPTYEKATQRIRIRAIVEAFEGERVTDTTESALEIRMVYRYEMEHLLARAGFEVEALYGGFDDRPIDEDSDEMIWVARRP